MDKIEKRKKLFEKEEFVKCLDDERHHMENLINSRFNFLLVITSAIFVLFATIKNEIILTIIIIISTIISILFSITIARAHAKFIELFNLTNDKFNNKRFYKHPAKLVDDLVNEKYKNNFFLGKSQKNLIGYWIPLIISIFLILLSIFYISRMFFIIFFELKFFLKTILYIIIYFLKEL